MCKKSLIATICTFGLAFTAYANLVGESKPKDLTPAVQLFNVELVGTSNDAFDGGKFKIILITNKDTHKKHTLVYHAGAEGESLLEIEEGK